MVTNTQNERKDSGKKKTLLILLFLALAVAMTVGSLLAFFSDSINGNEQVAAGTIDLRGSAKYYLNGSSTEATASDMQCINPGDTIVVKIGVENVGSKSAWLRSEFTLSAKDINAIDIPGAIFQTAFKVYEGSGTNGPELIPDAGTGAISFSEQTEKIINGSYETETATGAIGSAKNDMTFTIKFLEAATNEFQGANINIAYAVKALQYRNNTSFSNIAAGAWDSVQQINIPTLTPAPTTPPAP